MSTAAGTQVTFPSEDGRVALSLEPSWIHDNATTYNIPPTTNSDSEDDFDYIPPADDHDSDSSDELVETTVTAIPVSDSTEQKKQRDALWASFQASVSAPPSSERGQASSHPPPAKSVKIEKTFLFAGKHVTQVVEVDEDSEDAKKWPRWSPSQPTTVPISAPKEEQGRGDAGGERKDRSPTPPRAAPSPVPPATTPTPSAKRPGPRKSRTALPLIPNKASQVKKITTLDKSAMDWRAHVASQSSDLKDELDANMRGGGYLEKVEFLKRVEDRRENAFEASRASKRRKT